MLIPLSSLPAVNASLNGASAAFLIAGYSFIRRGKIMPHRVCMITAFLSSTAFLIFYVYFHLHAGIIRFGGQGWIRPVYFTLLTSHTILAVTIVPLVLMICHAHACGNASTATAQSPTGPCLCGSTYR